MGDEFTRRKIEWLLLVAAKPNMGPLSYRIAIVLVDKFNRASKEAWPTQQTIARELDVTERGVRKAIEQLISSGLLVKAAGAHKRASNRYSMSGFERNVCSLQASHQDRNAGSCQIPAGERNQRSGHDHEKEEPAFRSKQDLRGTRVPFERNKSVDLRGTPVPTETIEEPIEETTESLSIKNSLFDVEENPPKKVKQNSAEKLGKANTDPDFETWWLCCPKKVGKDAARKAFDRVLKSKTVTVNELIDGIRRYARERAHEDPKFTKHPATWLTGGCWADEPQASSEKPYQPQRPGSGMARALAGIFSAPDEDAP